LILRLPFGLDAPLRQIGIGRLLTTTLLLLAALLFARFSWSFPLSLDAERALYDVRSLVAAPHITQDDRIVMIVYTDDTLEHTGKRSPLDRALLAKALTNIDKLGAKAIGIDILIDEEQPEDKQLVAAFRSMKTPVHLAFAANASNSVYVQPWQEAFMRHFQASLKPGNVHPTSIRIEADPDGVMRSWPTRPPGLPPLLANAMVPSARNFANYQGSLLYRLPKNDERPVFASLPIDLFADPVAAEMMRNQVQGRYVLMGGDISDIDQFDTPATRLTGRTTTGLEIHATMLAQLLDNRRPIVIPPTLIWVSAALVVLFAAAAGFAELPPLRSALVVAGTLALLIVLPLVLQRANIDTHTLPMFGWLGGWVTAYFAASTAARQLGSEQRRFAQSALGKYLPPDVANQILKDPDQLALHGEKREIIALFTDLEGFTQLSHQIQPEQVAGLLNRYLDLLSDIVLEHGGTLDKFVGDAVIAFWGAPIARPDDADRAVKAAIAMYRAGEEFRRDPPPGIPPIGRTRVGVHRGEAIVGNFGGEGRIQYTALGDSMNAASRLESANKKLETTLLISREVRDETTLDCLRPMGRVQVRGRTTPLEIYEAGPDYGREEIETLADLLRRFDGGDRSALEALASLVASRPDDIALANLHHRLQEVGPGGCYALD